MFLTLFLGLFIDFYRYFNLFYLFLLFFYFIIFYFSVKTFNILIKKFQYFKTTYRRNYEYFIGWKSWQNGK